MGKVINQAIGWDANNSPYNYTIYKPKGDENEVPGYHVNQNKILHLCFYKIQQENLLTSALGTILQGIMNNEGNSWDNWRDGKSTIDAAAIDSLVVPNNIYPVLENFTIQGGFTLGSKDVAETMRDGSNSILEGIYNAAGVAAKIGEGINTAISVVKTTGGNVAAAKGAKEGLDALLKMNNAEGNAADDAVMTGMLTSKFDNFPIFNAEETRAIAPGQIDLQFNIGSGNYFDGELEVVRPIAAIENKVIPVHIGGSPNKLRGPMGSPAQFSAAVWGATAGAIGDTILTIGEALSVKSDGIIGEVKKSGIKEAAGDIGAQLAKLGYNIQENVIAAKDAAVAALGPFTTLLFMRLGNSTIGPFVIESCSHVFDYSQVDEKGYPARGTLSIKVKYIFKPNLEDNLTQMGYKVENSENGK